MKNRTYIAALAIQLASVQLWGNTHAESVEPIPSELIQRGPVDASEKTSSLHSYSIGITAGSYFYREPGLMQEPGSLVGLQFCYGYRFDNKMDLKIEYAGQSGIVSYSSVGTGTAEDYSVDKADIRFLIGYKPQSESMSEGEGWAPYIGLGYRYLFNDLRGTSSTGHSGYRRYNDLLYLPLGTHYTTQLMGLKTVFKAEVDLLLLGLQGSCMEDVYSDMSRVENRQHAGFGYRLGALFELDRVSFGPYFTYWQIEDSDYSTMMSGSNIVTVWEPANKSTEWGLELNYYY